MEASTSAPLPVSPSLHPRSPFSFLSRSRAGAGSSHGSHPLTGGPSAASSAAHAPPRRRPWYSLLIPRSRARTVLLALCFLSTVVGVLFSFSILSIDLPPLDQYDVEQTPAANISRSFEEPDYALLTSPQPHTIGCPQRDHSGAPLLLIGIFSAPDKVDRRKLLREKVIPDWPSELVEFRFIFGRPTTRAYERLLADEQEAHGDIQIVDAVEHIDYGKTFAFFEWVAERRYGEPPKFVMKHDDDTFMVMPNVIDAFASFDCSKNIYWGTSAGMSHHFGFYMRGLGYALSWPLVAWIGRAEILPAHIYKWEDARTGQWLRNLDPTTDPVTIIDNGFSMGDYNQLDFKESTVALHWLKWDDWVVEQRQKIKDLWAEAGRPYAVGHGVHWQTSVADGKIEPEARRKEHERQKAEGWNV